MKTRIVLILITLLCVAMASVQSARATIITVTNTNDGGAGSLRQALADANDGDTIDFSVTTPAAITLTSGELLVNKSVTISGPGADQLSMDGNAASTVFHISPGKTAIVSDLTITNGTPGVVNDQATLTINNSTLSGNVGGGIANIGGTLTINNSSLSGNGGAGDGVGDGVLGGGIYNGGSSGSAAVTINNSTLSNNLADHYIHHGGGSIYNEGFSGSAMVTINNSTLSDNGAYDGGAISNRGGSATLTIGNTILKNQGYDSGNIYNEGGTVISLGYNLSSDDASAFLNATGDQNSTDPMLGPLQNNGGPTFTRELSTSSPAIDAGDPSFTPPPDYDQRGPGFARAVNGRIDIGAFEVQSGPPLTCAAQVQPPINADWTSIFNFRRGVVPVKFSLTCDGNPTCDLPPATIAVTRTGGGVIGEINESVYSGTADSGSNFRVLECQYHYNLNSRALGAGTYRVDILIDGQVVGSAAFQLE